MIRRLISDDRKTSAPALCSFLQRFILLEDTQSIANFADKQK